ncbi:UNVERIFIED_CONTAM: hypothetical protein Sradi_1059800 [Sesamum radiatum]|uniref:Uncharacterized protein n=1 Tax=Sesamum radiatum TaxID=300843 RepID=A0AAW2V9U5_SESRA
MAWPATSFSHEGHPSPPAETPLFSRNSGRATAAAAGAGAGAGAVATAATGASSIFFSSPRPPRPRPAPSRWPILNPAVHHFFASGELLFSRRPFSQEHTP